MLVLVPARVMLPPPAGNSPVSLTVVVNGLTPGTPTVVFIAVARPLYLWALVWFAPSSNNAITANRLENVNVRTNMIVPPLNCLHDLPCIRRGPIAFNVNVECQ